jgi:hypothetical protein
VTTQSVTYLVADPDNQPPVASDDTDATPRNVTIVVDVLDNDTDDDDNLDPASLSIVTLSVNATVTHLSDGTVFYNPDQGFEGIDSFDYQICDTAAACDTATATVVVGDAACTIVGTSGDDTLTGTGGADISPRTHVTSFAARPGYPRQAPIPEDTPAIVDLGCLETLVSL